MRCAATLLWIVFALLAAPRSGGAQEAAFPVVASLTAGDSAAYLRGEGQGMALAAELNGFPGPRHVLAVADTLALTQGQRAALVQIENRMRARVEPLGRQLAGTELALDSLFAGGQVTDAVLDSLISRWGSLGARLRAAHLRAHVATRAVLTPGQLARYRALAPGAAHARAHQHMSGMER